MANYKKIACLMVSLSVFLCSGAFAAEIETNAKSVLLMEESSGTIIYKNNEHESLPPASVTKIMTMLLTFEAIDRGEIKYDTVVTTSERAKSMGGSTIFLNTNEQMTVNDLLKGIAVASGNDACVAMAEHLSGSVEDFVIKMNTRAKELGMKDTNFVNCTGLDDEKHYTSAYDIAMMSRVLFKHKDVFKYTTIWMDSLRNGKFQLANTNKLIRFYKGANGLKTGSTSVAGSCISAAAKRDGMQLIAVVLGAPSSKERFATASALLNYGFSKYSVTKFGKKGDEVKEIKVKNGVRNSVMIVSSQDSSVLIEKSDSKNLKTHINMPDAISAPVKKGANVGEMIITLDGKTIAKTDLIAKENVQKKKAYHYFSDLMTDIFTCAKK